jgi:hypothetical protein
MRGVAMRKTMRAAAATGAAMIAVLALAGCPTQPGYPSTITPIYAVTSGRGLFVYNGTSWTNYTNANTATGLRSTSLTSVVVSGSGSGATVFAGGNASVSQFDGKSWSQLTSGLGSTTVNRLFLGSGLYAATTGGLSILNGDGQTWSNNPAQSPVYDVFIDGNYTLVAAGTGGAAGLHIFNGTSLVGTTSPGAIVPTSTTVQSVFVDFSGDLIVGTDKGLAVQYAGSASFSANVLPTAASVSQITTDSNGNFYAATTAGLYRIGASAVLALSGAVSCVCVDGAGTIYAGTATGLHVSRNGGLTWTTELSEPQVTAVTTTAPLYSF